MPNLRWQELFIFLIFFAVPLALYIWLIIWVGKRALQKGYSRAGFTVFTIFLPVIAWIVVLVLDPRPQPPAPTMAKCPHCAEGVLPEAQVCKHCGRDITPAITPDA